MRKSTFLIVASLFAIFTLSAQELTNSVHFSGPVPQNAIVGGEAILSADLNVVDSVPANLMFGIIEQDANGNVVGQPVAMKIIHLTDVAPYSKTVVDTVNISADVPLSSTLTNGDTYAYFCSILTSAYTKIDQEYSNVNVVDTTAGNTVNFATTPYGVVMLGSKVALSADLNIADATPANMMFGIIKLDANGKAVGQPVAMKIIHLSDIAPYSKTIVDTVALSTDIPLSSTLTNGETYAYFCSILTAAYGAIDQKYVTADVVDTVNAVSFTSSLDGSAAPGEKIAASVGIRIADASPANLMIGIIERDANNKVVGQPTVMKIIPLDGTAPYCKEISDTISIPADHALSSTLTSGDKFSYFCSILTSAFAAIDQNYTDVSIIVTSVQDNYINKNVIYPSPATDKIHISDYQSNENVEIYDITGSMVQSDKLSTNQIDVSKLRPGIYFIKGESFVSKFIKQ